RRVVRECLPVRIAPENGGDGIGERLPGKRAPPGEHLVEHASEGPDVGAFVHRLATCLFGTHVGDGTEEHALARAGVGQCRRVGEVGGLIAGDDLRQPEIEDLHDALGSDLDVGWLQIAMNESLLMRGVERVRNLLSDYQSLRYRDGATLDAVSKRLALY